MAAVLLSSAFTVPRTGEEEEMIRRATLMGWLVVVLVWIPRPASAALILGGQLFVQSDGTVTAKYLGDFADFTSTLFLYDPINGNQILFTNNGGSAEGATVNLGSFNAGDELIFGLIVDDGIPTPPDVVGDFTFYTGPGVAPYSPANPDGVPHAMVSTDPFTDVPLIPGLPPGALAFLQGNGLVATDTLVGFEDKHLLELLANPQNPETPDYNDLVYAFTNVGLEAPPDGGGDSDGSVPEPATLLLFGAGAAGVAARAGRKNR